MTLITGCAVTTANAAPKGASSDRYAAIVIDANTGKTLFAANPDNLRYPASLTKMMTIYMMFEAMKAGRINKDTRIPVSAYAASRPPTKIGFKPGQSIRVEDAILALITKSANDVAAATGEYLGGSEARFAQMMTTKARRLGMRNTTFRNASGLPNAAQRSTARDMALLGMALRAHFPQEYAYFSRSSFVYGGTTIRGHNRLLGRIEGVDGIKTGYTNASGFNLVSSVKIDGRNIVAVVMGGNSGASRDAHMAELIKKYLPDATRGGRGNSLIAARSEVPQVVATLPAPAQAPLPVQRKQDGGIAQVINAQAEETALPTEPEVLALMAPTANPAARAAEAVIAPKPRAAVRNAQPTRQDVDPVTTASAASTRGWAIQIGSLPSEDQATAMLEKATASAKSSLKKASAQTQTFQKGGKMFYRARFVGFSDKQAAWNACEALKKQKFGCYAVAD